MRVLRACIFERALFCIRSSEYRYLDELPLAPCFHAPRSGNVVPFDNFASEIREYHLLWLVKCGVYLSNDRCTT